jgi:hypothetical protein
MLRLLPILAASGRALTGLALTGLALSGLALTGLARADAGIPALQEQVATAHGGREALHDIQGFEARGRILSLADGLNGRLDWEVSRKGDLRARIEYPNRWEVRILSGRLAWHGGKLVQRPSGSDMTASMQLQYHRLVAPFEFVEADPAELALDGLSPEGWIRVVRTWDEDVRTIYEVEAETGRILRVIGEIGSGETTLSFVTESHDFREVEGVLFPFRMTTRVAGQAAAETILDRVEVRQRFAPGTFLPEGVAGDM